MTLYGRGTLPALLKETKTKPSQVYLFFGDRYLCQDTAKQIEEILLESSGTLHPINGEQEDIATLTSKLKSFSLLPGRQIFKVTDTKLFHSKNVAKQLWEKADKAHQANKTKQATRALRSFLDAAGIAPQSEESQLSTLTNKEWQHYFGFSKPESDLSWTAEPISTLSSKKNKQSSDSTEQFLTCLLEQLPSSNILLLLAEEVDKRKKTYKVFKNNFVVVDLSVDAGASSKAKKVQKEVLLSLIRQTLAEMNKTIAPGVTDRLIERVGFHPVAVVNELRKVMLFIEEKKQITAEDLDAVVGRTRQEAIFELTGALTAGNLAAALTIADRLIENGYHPLALIASLRNATRSLLLYRTLQEQAQYGYSVSMSPNLFQTQCLPRLKENTTWKKELSGHPYALYSQFKTAARYSLTRLQQWLTMILKAEMKLKGSHIPPKSILDNLFLAMLTDEKKHL